MIGQKFDGVAVLGAMYTALGAAEGATVDIIYRKNCQISHVLQYKEFS
jgi:hypothetical protein